MGQRLKVEIVPSATLRAPGLAAWLTSIAPSAARGAVTVVLLSDARVRELNRRFRKKDRPTDVLSFPSVADEPRADGRRYLGDVVIAAGLARRQAKEVGHSIQTELRVLALHGLLHLLGYDHERDAGRMDRLERRLCRQGGLREGLIERSPRRARAARALRRRSGQAPRLRSGRSR